VHCCTVTDALESVSAGAAASKPDQHISNPKMKHTPKLDSHPAANRALRRVGSERRWVVFMGASKTEFEQKNICFFVKVAYYGNSE
jgi:hypothetical protein